MSKSIHTLEDYPLAFRKMLQIVALLNTNYSPESNIEDVSDGYVAEFVEEMNFDNFYNLYLEIEITQIKNLKWEDRRDAKINKIITFVYCSNKFEIKTAVTKKFFKSARNLLYGSNVIYHSHVTGQVTGYAHDFCNKKMRENKNLIPVFAHNLFSFDFFCCKRNTFVCLGNKTAEHWRNQFNKCPMQM